MAIVRGDRREFAQVRLRDIRETLSAGLVEVGAALAALDDLEVRLGLTTEGEVAARDQHYVVHCRAGDKEAHPLDECVDLDCVPSIVAERNAEKDVEAEEDEEPDPAE